MKKIVLFIVLIVLFGQLLGQKEQNPQKSKKIVEQEIDYSGKKVLLSFNSTGFKDLLAENLIEFFEKNEIEYVQMGEKDLKGLKKTQEFDCIVILTKIYVGKVSGKAKKFAKKLADRSNIVMVITNNKGDISDADQLDVVAISSASEKADEQDLEETTQQTIAEIEKILSGK